MYLSSAKALHRHARLVACAVSIAATVSAYAQTTAAKKSVPLTIQTDKQGAAIQPTMWGVFFEDINFGADGGLYAELVKNRSFEFFTPLMGWKEEKGGQSTGSVLIENRSATTPANPRYAHITVNAADGRYSLTNEGFRGMGLRKDGKYVFSIQAKRAGGGEIRIVTELLDNKGDVIGSGFVSPSSGTWQRYSVIITAATTDPRGKLRLRFEGAGAVDIDMVSLFPQDTWKQRPGGLRADLVQLLADIKPGFLRFPGGCIVEGRELTNRYQWKKTVGPLEDREVIVNRWNTEFRHRPAPDYFQSFGLGFFEYFQLAEDLGAEPLPILNCGMACQFNTSEVVPLEGLDPYVQDALDLIEFANGDTQTPWGKLRASLGHPAPFNLKLMGIGNEQWGSQYIDRYKVFAKALKDRYPNVKLVTSIGPGPDGPLFDYLDPTLRGLGADILDEHYYKAPDWFLQQAARYDNYDRNGPKIFAGEYAAQSNATATPENRNTWRCALAEAAFMTGLERNADVVYMASYAPLFAHVDGWQWTPDLIWFDNLRAYGTPNYHVQKLFSLNKGTAVLPLRSGGKALTGQDGLYSAAVWDEKAKDIVVKIVNTAAQPIEAAITLEGAKRVSGKGTVITLAGDTPEAENSLDNPASVAPIEKAITVKGKRLNIPVPAGAFVVVRIGAR